MNSQTSINAALRGKINTQPPVEKQSGRFLPSETPRSVALDKEGAPPNLASNVSFNPVATINSANSQRYVAPVRNTYNRPVSTSVLNKDGQVAIRGERVIELNNNLHEQIKAKVNRQTPYEKKTLIAPTMAPTPVQPRPTQPQSTVVKSTEAASHDKARADELKKQLSEINKVLFEQIRQKIASELARQQNQVQTQASSTPKQPAFKTPKPVSGVPVSNPNALNQKATSASQPVVNQQKPGSAVAKAVEAPTQPKSPTTTAAKERPVPTTTTQAQAFPAAPEKKQNVSPNKDEVQSHITNIERKSKN